MVSVGRSAMTLGAVLLIAFLAASVLTGLVRRYSLRRRLVDVPNQRSSHAAPTPRGGGLAIVLVCLAALVSLAVAGALEVRLAASTAGPAAVVATAGWLDDHGHVPALWRLVVQFAAATATVLLLGGFEALKLGTYVVHLGVAGDLLAILGLVWLTNLFNFMDGIDGIAAVETVVVAGAGGILLLSSGAAGLGSAALFTSAAAAGFLLWNWPPARIFMGDVGSGFLGFLLGALALASDRADALPVYVWALLLAVFLFDATVTVLRRLGREPLHEAHRRHAYQRAVSAGLSHRAVTLSVLAFNLVFVGLAASAWVRPVLAPYSLLIGLGLLLTGYMMIERRRPMWSEPPACYGPPTHERPGAAMPEERE
jgi:Fuc2NAc and GlcNAc transferase